MKLYIWYSDILRDYSSGCAVATGTNVMQARGKLILYAVRSGASDNMIAQLKAELKATPNVVVDVNSDIAAFYMTGGG